MRVALVEPDISPQSHTIFAGNNELEPLGLEYLAGAATEIGWDARVYVERILGSRLLDELVTFRPEVVGITCLTCNSNHALELAREIKKHIPCQTVMGGYHASSVPAELALQSCVDWVAVGEGERAFCTLLKNMEAGNGTCSTGKIVSAERIGDLAVLPRPQRDVSILSNSRILGLMVPSPSEQTRVASVCTLRGCHNSCQFCASGVMWGGGVVCQRSAIDVADEMAQLAGHYGVDAVFLADLSFNANREHVEGVCNALIRAGSRIPWYCMCCMDNLTDDVISLMAEAGCRKIGVGVESPVYSERKRVKDGYVAANDALQSTIACAHKSGVLVKGYFMVGYPWETEQSLQEFEDALNGFAFDEIKISFYTPFPGTHAYSEYQGLLLSNDWDAFDTVSRPLIRNPRIPSDQLISWRKSCFAGYYSSRAYKALAEEACKRNTELIPSYSEFAKQLSEALSLTGLALAETCGVEPKC